MQISLFVFEKLFTKWANGHLTFCSPNLLSSAFLLAVIGMTHSQFSEQGPSKASSHLLGFDTVRRHRIKPAVSWANNTTEMQHDIHNLKTAPNKN